MSEEKKEKKKNPKTKKGITPPKLKIRGKHLEALPDSLYRKAIQREKDKVKPVRIPRASSADIRNMLIKALKKSGGVRYLEQQAQENPVAFMNLLGKAMPKDINININQHVDKLILEARRKAKKGMSLGEIADKESAVLAEYEDVESVFTEAIKDEAEAVLDAEEDEGMDGRGLFDEEDGGDE
jgi:hypothetical protein